MLRNHQDVVTDVTFEVMPMIDADIKDVVSFFKSFPEVHFCIWENEILLHDLLSKKSSACYVARSRNETARDYVVGAIIGGKIGVRATINHLAVHKTYQRRGVARKLVEHAFAKFQSQGVQRVFLFIVDEAADARRFWTKMGFKPVVNETTCELDLPSQLHAIE